MRFEVGVGQRPVGKGGPGDLAVEGTLAEIALVKAPVVGGEVDRAAAHLTAVSDGFERHGRFVFVAAVGDGLDARIVGEALAADVVNLVVGEILLAKVRPLLQDNDAEAGGGEFLGHDSARGAGADDNEVHRF